ncbi:excinuclease ABC subunit UvrB [Odoribacter sp. OttesenSCG-928-G04]|nr:excinuclease ABC subunit UvrB [Odoribacter sp. OttesenSCG-928-G04]MDL2331133.1 excinuclease ABC subunit UvrB [Odoribacter sp. OttesenSCG-928-A06]
MDFKLTSEFVPTGDQPEAISQLKKGLENDLPYQVLLGVTGSGKTFTIANLINEVKRPALILSHNKTLAAQLYEEFKSFFPNNAVEYFVSYYDYYQPEAYLPTTDTYIEKDLQINDEIDKLRLRTTASLLSGRKDIIVVSSVSCLYGMADPKAFDSNIIHLKQGMKITRNNMLRRLVDALYAHNEIEFKRGSFRTKGDTVDIFPAIETYDGVAYRIEFWDDEIERMTSFEPSSGKTIETLDVLDIYPANLFVTDKETVAGAIVEIENDLRLHLAFLKESGKHLEAKRLEERVRYDIEMIRELGYCPGIENYSRYFDGRKAGVRPFCLLDYFSKDFLMVIDESHVTIPQIRAMYGGDHARKQTLIEYGFRLPAAFDNRPLTFNEFEDLAGQTVYISATPADYELEKTDGVVVEQIIRPTGIPDPIIEVVPSLNQIDHLLNEIQKRIELNERTLVTTLTKKMAEELSKYLDRMGVKCQYIHSDVETLERVKILKNLREGLIDVIVGVNLLREGLDLPEVSLVAILDADKEGFLRSTRSLVQTAGRAARHIDGKVIMYADKITRSMQATIDETQYRREKQLKYNADNNITPQRINKSLESTLGQQHAYIEKEGHHIVADPVATYMSSSELEKMLQKTKTAMQKAAKEQDFLEAARLRDEMFALEKQLQKNK